MAESRSMWSGLGPTIPSVMYGFTVIPIIFVGIKRNALLVHPGHCPQRASVSDAADLASDAPSDETQAADHDRKGQELGVAAAVTRMFWVWPSGRRTDDSTGVVQIVGIRQLSGNGRKRWFAEESQRDHRESDAPSDTGT